MRVLIVGQNPSKKNIDPYTPFDGTRSGVTVNKWLDKLEVHKSMCYSINCKNSVDYKFNEQGIRETADYLNYSVPFMKYDKILALGKIAHKVLAQAGIAHFELPHPSGRNRKLNDKKWLSKQLELAKEYVWAR